jgi:uncharacterized protein
VSRRFADLLHRYRIPLLILAALVLVVSLPLAGRLQMDWKLERMFVPGDPLVASYHRLEDRFGGNQAIIAAYRDPELWDRSGAGLKRLETISNALKQTEGVAAVLSLAELHRILERVRAISQLPKLGGLLDFNRKESSERNLPSLLDDQDPLAQAYLKVFSGYTHQPGSDYVAIGCLLDYDGGSTTQMKTIAGLREIMEKLPEPAENGILAGEPIMVSDGFQLVQSDGRRLGITSTILLSVVLLACFRSIRWTLIPLAIVHWSIVVTEATLAALQLELTIVSSMLTAIVTVIGVATTMHILLRFQRLRSDGLANGPAMVQTFETLLFPVALACITDAVGFASLMIADVGPVRDFGLMMAIGAMVVLVAILLLIPGLATIGKWDSGIHIPALDLPIRNGLRKLLDMAMRRRKLGLVLLILLSVAAFMGGQRMVVETDFTKNFYSSSPLVRGYQVVEGNLGGAGVWDVMLPAPANITTNYLAKVLELEKQLAKLSVNDGRELIQLTKVLSIADADGASQAMAMAAAVPVAARLEVMRQVMPEFTRSLLTDHIDESGFRWLRIMLRSKEQATADAKTKLIDQVNACVAQYTRESAWQELLGNSPTAEVTGYHVMLSRLVSNVIDDQWKCFALATLGIFVVVFMATRSAVLALASLVPNALPIMVVLGAMGWLGMTVNIGAAMIAAVSMGLSIDNSIHYILHYQKACRAGEAKYSALQSAQENVGLAVVLATISLIAGFLALSVSEFIPTVVFGTMTSLTMLGGLFGNLLVLPLLIGEASQPNTH